MNSNDDEFEQIIARLSAEMPAAAGAGEPATQLAAVLTPVASSAALAGLLAMGQLECRVVGSSTGAVAIRELTAPPDPFAEMSGQAPAEADELAATLSRLLHTDVVLLVSRLAADGDETQGKLSAWRYSGGALAESVAPGLVMAGADQIVEDVLVGQVKLDSLGEDTAKIPRWRAARMFRRGVRKRKQ